MGFSAANTRWRREDCEYVKHDKLFSKWKILVGPSDWREVQGIGRSRYQMQNVPAMEFGPGVLELGVTAPSWSPGLQQLAQPLKMEDVIPVYVGQATNVRQRLHKFGQAASSRSAKLYQGDEDSETFCGSASSTNPWLVQSGGGEAKSFARSGPRLFSEVFALGSSIAFRWAHTDSKAVAEQVVAELLSVFDYAWNKGPNGTRRSRDILAKLFTAWPITQDSGRSSARKRSWLLRPVGIKVALRKPRDPKPKTLMGKKNVCFLMTLQPQVPFEPRRHKQNDRMKNQTTLQLDQRKRTVNHLMRWSCFPTRSNKRPGNHETVEEQPRRPCSLSFNTWVKLETDDQRVRDVTDSGVKGSGGMASKRKVRRFKSSMYALIMAASDDTREGSNYTK